MDDLLEVNLENWSGFSFDEIKERFPDQYKTWKENPEDLSLKDKNNKIYYPIKELFTQADRFIETDDVATCLKIFEKLCGQRLNYSYIRVGGVTFDMTDEILADIQGFADYFDPAILDEYDALLSFNGIFISRTANVGILSPQLAIDHGVTSPWATGTSRKSCSADRWTCASAGVTKSRQEPRATSAT